MDFLVLVAIHLILWLIGLTCYTWADHPLLTSRPLRLIRQITVKLTNRLLQAVPLCLKHAASSLVNYVFFSRNHVFQVIYVVLIAAATLVALFDVLPILSRVDSQISVIFWPLVLLLVNLVLFTACCVSDPGVITPSTSSRYRHLYQPDGVLYKAAQRCLTCRLLKPARAKHCVFTDKCVFKFDHYCVWTNNTVGGLNHRLFVGFLLSVVALSLYGAMLALRALANITTLYKLWQLRYLDQHGHPQPITFMVLAQTLFMQYPRLVFLAVALIVVTIVMTCFTGYHAYLTATNQTTNERYKAYYMRRAGIKVKSMPYNRGLIQNILEDWLPLYQTNILSCSHKSS